MKNNNNSYKDGFHLSSKHWQDIKLKIPNLNNKLIEILIGTLLGDSCMYNKGINKLVKFEQGAIHK